MSEKRYGPRDWSDRERTIYAMGLVNSRSRAEHELKKANDRLNALEAERDELKQYVDDLLDRPTYAGEYEQLRKASHIMAENYRSLEAELDRYKSALERIKLMDPDWTIGVDENMSRLQSIAARALKGGDEE